MKKKSKIVSKFVWLIVLLFLGFAGFKAYERYSFTKERADLATYIGVTGDEVAIYLNDSLQNHYDTDIKYKAIMQHDTVYIPLSFVKSFINNRFYYAKDIN
ncbi:MAG: hypothetical protein IKP66_01445, partial [Lachnospiraceae bacterium]|nr:hypothetical protein [Lachnospiraceae bacterium]